MSNLTLMKKIDETTDVQHLLTCIFAGAKRVRMQPQVTDQTLGKQDQQNKGKENKMIVSRMDKQILPANLHPAVCVSKMSQLMGRAKSSKGKGKGKSNASPNEVGNHNNDTQGREREWKTRFYTQTETSHSHEACARGMDFFSTAGLPRQLWSCVCVRHA